MRRLREQVLPRPELLSQDATWRMEDEVDDIARLRRIGRESDDWKPITQAERLATTFENRHHMPVAAGEHSVLAEPFLHQERFDAATPAEAGQAWQHAHAAVQASHAHLVRLAERHGPSAQQDFERAEQSHLRLAQIEDTLNADVYDRWGTDGQTLHAVSQVGDEAAASMAFRHNAIDRASDHEIGSYPPYWSTDTGQSGVILVPRSHLARVQSDTENVGVRVGDDGTMNVGLTTLTGQHIVDPDLASVAGALRVDEATAHATVLEAAHQLQRGQVAFSTGQTPDLADPMKQTAPPRWEPSTLPEQRRAVQPELEDAIEATQYLRDRLEPADALRSLGREPSDRHDIAAATFNDEKIDAVADARIGATSVRFGESIDDASVDLANYTHGWDRVQVHIDADNHVRANVIGPHSSTGADLPAVAAALGINEADAKQAVMEAAHQLQRGQVAYDATSDTDADEQVEAFDQERGQQARESLTWTADNTREQEQTMSETNPQDVRQELLDEGYPSDYIDGPERNDEARAVSAEYDNWDVTGGPVHPGDDVGIRVDDDGGVHATVVGSEGVVTRDADPSQLATAWNVDEDTAQREALQWAGDGATEGQDLRWAGPDPESATATVEAQNNEPDVDEMVNMGMVDDRAIARQGQDRAEPGRQPVDMARVQEQIASLDAVGAGHHDRYSFENTQPTQDDPTMRM